MRSWEWSAACVDHNTHVSSSSTNNSGAASVGFTFRWQHWDSCVCVYCMTPGLICGPGQVSFQIAQGSETQLVSPGVKTALLSIHHQQEHQVLPFWIFSHVTLKSATLETMRAALVFYCGADYHFSIHQYSSLPVLTAGSNSFLGKNKAHVKSKTWRWCSEP